MHRLPKGWAVFKYGAGPFHHPNRCQEIHLSKNGWLEFCESQREDLSILPRATVTTERDYRIYRDLEAPSDDWLLKILLFDQQIYENGREIIVPRDQPDPCYSIAGNKPGKAGKTSR